MCAWRLIDGAVTEGIGMNRMTFTKEQCIGLAPQGWEYTGFSYATGRYAYQQKRGNGFAVMLCEAKDLTEKNLAFMAKHNLSRVVRRGDLA